MYIKGRYVLLIVAVVILAFAGYVESIKSFNHAMTLDIQKNNAMINSLLVKVSIDDWFAENDGQVPTSLSLVGSITKTRIYDEIERNSLHNPFTQEPLRLIEEPTPTEIWMLSQPISCEPGDVVFTCVVVDSMAIWSVRSYGYDGQPLPKFVSRRWVNDRQSSHRSSCTPYSSKVLCF